MVSKDELLSEFRHKYLVILKSQYWDFFEHGLCMPNSVIIMMESVDKCMDNESEAMDDYKFAID